MPKYNVIVLVEELEDEDAGEVWCDSLGTFEKEQEAVAFAGAVARKAMDIKTA